MTKMRFTGNPESLTGWLKTLERVGIGGTGIEERVGSSRRDGVVRKWTYWSFDALLTVEQLSDLDKVWRGEKWNERVTYKVVKR